MLETIQLLFFEQKFQPSERVFEGLNSLPEAYVQAFLRFKFNLKFYFTPFPFLGRAQWVL